VGTGILKSETRPKSYSHPVIDTSHRRKRPKKFQEKTKIVHRRKLTIRGYTCQHKVNPEIGLKILTKKMAVPV
jgi:hypothetical protein